jgi:hypothetical protein
MDYAPSNCTVTVNDGLRRMWKLAKSDRTKISVNYNPSSVLTAQKTHTASVIKAIQLVLHREVIGVCSEIHTNVYNPGRARG